MTLAYAGLIGLVVVLLVLYLGLVRLHYDVRQLRRLVLEQMQSRQPDLPLGLPRGSSELYGRTVLALSTTCDTCWAALAEARAHADGRTDLVVLTYQDPHLFASEAGDLTVVHSPGAWSVISPLPPPVLLRVAPDGRLDTVVLPAAAGDVSATLSRWDGQGATR